MKNFILITLTFITLAFSSCAKVERNDSSIIPDRTNSRENYELGTIYVASRNLTITAWDHGTVDGDIVSLYLNGGNTSDRIINNYTLDGPYDKKEVDAELKYNGYNYLVLFAHNEGSISPNTCTIEIYDGEEYQTYTLEANLLTNGAINIVVN